MELWGKCVCCATTGCLYTAWHELGVHVWSLGVTVHGCQSPWFEDNSIVAVVRVRAQ